ncbi:homoserine O-acetyltransferase [Virgibacillus soli]|uniref:Homoserine O-acetyltransferase n=1 Tax=Paracerasibacillus soli TaxID=480284 RepID=A0ABU5CNM7_9BACI|nr:homoserine O-acetyltransferase [Virgibacillus soli]MDY0407962.1 homoserine O-acetyltransferase [Virgibacillus soli]
MSLVFDQTNATKSCRSVADIEIGSLRLTSGKILKKVKLRYELVGPPAAPVILVCHALTGNHLTVGSKEEPGWWSGLIGEQNYIDTNKFRILTFNVLGGCNGSTGPSSINPATNEMYRMTFPVITVKDIVKAQYKALQKLRINHLAGVVGGSLGGMQVMEWGLLYPKMMDKLIILAATPVLSDYGIGFNYIAESAIKNDVEWNGGEYGENQMLRGLEIARMLGMVTYRSSHLFHERFQREKQACTFSVISYLDYQGKKLTQRFDANSYLYLLGAMNYHDIGEGRGGWETGCKSFEAPILTIGYGDDLIYEPDFIQKFSKEAPNCSYHFVPTSFGHDGFLTEYEKWGNIIKEFLN